MHGGDLFYYFTSLAIDFPDLTAAWGRVYNNTDFQTAFSRSFISFAISLDPNIKVEPTITPSWNKWAVKNTEMLFNRTDSGLPVVKPVKTSDEFLERCRFWAMPSNVLVTVSRAFYISGDIHILLADR
ncbi:hypothetical protein C8J57DRAFT_1543781 [Mycena rebaudengoi]|nr:hypothetical protein C8J57DRAFT_1543781 [Mycena rebaudengoi]